MPRHWPTRCAGRTRPTNRPNRGAPERRQQRSPRQRKQETMGRHDDPAADQNNWGWGGVQESRRLRWRCRRRNTSSRRMMPSPHKPDQLRNAASYMVKYISLETNVHKKYSFHVGSVKVLRKRASDETRGACASPMTDACFFVALVGPRLVALSRA